MPTAHSLLLHLFDAATAAADPYHLLAPQLPPLDAAAAARSAGWSSPVQPALTSTISAPSSS